jgi:flagellar hook-associated protein 2
MAGTESISGGIHFTGLGNGTDFDAIIEATVQVEGLKKQQLENWKSEWEAKIEGFQLLNTALLNLKSNLEALDTPREFLIKDAVVNDTTILSATASSDADEGNHTVEVGQLAQNQVITYSTSETSDTDVVNSSGVDQTFSYNYAGTEYSVNVPNGQTLQGLVNAVNNDPNNPGVRASILKVADGDYRMQMRGLDQGAANTLEASSGATLTGYTATDDVITQLSQDSEFKIDGFPSGANWLSRSNNTISDALEGLTLNLKDVGTTQVTVNTDTSAIKENVRTFVADVNEVFATIKELTEFDDVNERGSLLTGNYGVQIISQNLKSITSGRGLGFDFNQDTITALSQIGITTDAEQGSPTLGQLKLDEEILDGALNSDIDAVARIFSADNDGISDSTDFLFDSLLEGTTEPGVYEVAYDINGSGDITAATINGRTANFDNTTKQITGASGNPEAGLAIQVTNLNTGSYTGNVRVQLGKSGELIEELKQLTNSTDGTLHILEDNYYDIIEGIDKKIEREEERLLRLERTLRLKYSRLDALLGEYTNQQAALGVQASSLGSSG